MALRIQATAHGMCLLLFSSRHPPDAVARASPAAGPGLRSAEHPPIAMGIHADGTWNAPATLPARQKVEKLVDIALLWQYIATGN